MVSLSEYKAKSNDLMASLQAEIEKLSKKNFVQDERFFYPEVDKSGNGGARIRFLDTSLIGEPTSFVEFHEHNFKGPTGLTYKQLCPGDLGWGTHRCPACDHNNELWNKGDQDSKRKASSQKRKHVFISNILIVKYPMKPELEGSVRLYRYGKQIFDKINKMLTPDPNTAGLDDDSPSDPVNVFNLMSGCDLILRIKTEDGYRKYSDSSFAKPAPVTKDDATFQRIVSQIFPLKPFVAKEMYKDYDTLKAQLDRVLGKDGTPVREVMEDEGTSEPDIGSEVSAPVEDELSSLTSTSDADFFKTLK